MINSRFFNRSELLGFLSLLLLLVVILPLCLDTFLVVVFGGAASLIGTIASAFSISQTQSTLEFFMSGSMAKVLTLLAVVGILMLRPQGLFALKVRK